MSCPLFQGLYMKCSKVCTRTGTMDGRTWSSTRQEYYLVFFDKRHDCPLCQGLKLASADSLKKNLSIILYLGICSAVFTGYLLWQIKADLVSTSFSWFVTVRFHIIIIHLISTFTLLTNFEFS